MARGDTYANPDAPDPVLAAELLVALAQKYAPDQADTTVIVDESGGEARAYLIGPDLVIKTQRPQRVRPRTSLAKEARILQALSGPLADRVPQLLGYDEAATDIGPVELIVMTRIPGQPVERAGADPARPQLFAALGEVLGVIHRLDTAELAQDATIPADVDAADVRARLADAFADVLDDIAAGPRWPLALPADTVAETALSALPTVLTEPLALLHSNPGPMHVFVDTAGTFSGLIDFGDSYLSHPALDLHRWPAPADRSALFEAYRVRWGASNEFTAVWAVAMVHADLKVIAGGGPLTAAATTDLLARLRGM